MSNSGVFGPTPEGVDLSETQNVAVSSAVISLMVIATIFVLLRVAARAMQKGVTMALAVDDYCIAVGLVCLPWCVNWLLVVLIPRSFSPMAQPCVLLSVSIF